MARNILRLGVKLLVGAAIAAMVYVGGRLVPVIFHHGYLAVQQEGCSATVQQEKAQGLSPPFQSFQPGEGTHMLFLADGEYEVSFVCPQGSSLGMNVAVHAGATTDAAPSLVPSNVGHI